MMKNGTTKAVMAELSAYDYQWNAMMVRIWKDRIGMLRAVNTRRLFDSVTAASPKIEGLSATFEFRFVMYGIYVDRGTGKGYKRGNGGNLDFLGRGYRSLHALGRVRKTRPWFTPSMAISQRVIAKKYMESLGDAFAGVFDDLTD